MPTGIVGSAGRFPGSGPAGGQSSAEEHRQYIRTVCLPLVGAFSEISQSRHLLPPDGCVTPTDSSVVPHEDFGFAWGVVDEQRAISGHKILAVSVRRSIEQLRWN